MMKRKINRSLRLLFWSFTIISTVLGAYFLAIVQPGGDGVLGRVELPDGSEYLIEQRCNWGFEPYTVSFYLRSPEGEWGWCYVDHEASRWRDVEMSYDQENDRIVVTEQGIKRAALDRKTQVFWINNGSIRRDLIAPQNARQPSFASLSPPPELKLTQEFKSDPLRKLSA